MAIFISPSVASWLGGEVGLLFCCDRLIADQGIVASRLVGCSTPEPASDGCRPVSSVSRPFPVAAIAFATGEVVELGTCKSSAAVLSSNVPIAGTPLAVCQDDNALLVLSPKIPSAMVVLGKRPCRISSRWAAISCSIGRWASWRSSFARRDIQEPRRRSVSD